MEQVSSNPTVQAQYDAFSKGYDAGVYVVLDAIEHYVRSGDSISTKNIDVWIKAFKVMNMEETA